MFEPSTLVPITSKTMLPHRNEEVELWRPQQTKEIFPYKIHRTEIHKFSVECVTKYAQKIITNEIKTYIELFHI